MEGGQSKQGFSSFLDTDVGKLRREEEGGREEREGWSCAKVQTGQRQPRARLWPWAEPPYLEAAVLIK